MIFAFVTMCKFALLFCAATASLVAAQMPAAVANTLDAPFYVDDEPTNPDDGPLGVERYGEVVDVWPYPQNVSVGNGVVEVHTSWVLRIDPESTDRLSAAETSLLQRALQRTRMNIFKDYKQEYYRYSIFEDKIGDMWPRHPVAGLAIPSDECIVTVRTSGNPLPHLGADEGYTLSVRDDGDCRIVSATVWGALHGLETLSQLVDFVTYDGRLGFYIQ